VAPSRRSRKGSPLRTFILQAAVLGLILTFTAPLSYARRRALTIFNADSLAGFMRDAAHDFETSHPGVRIQNVSSGSLDAIRRATDLHLPCDIVITADWRLLLKPHHGIEPWVVIFAGNSMALVYTNHSAGAREINSNNWYRVITQPPVRYGHSNPERDPAGYWTLIVWQLAESYYHQPGLAANLKAHCPLSNIRPASIDLIALLQSGELDYYFGYASDARLGNLKFLALPAEINLGHFSRRDYYSKASVEVGSGAHRRRINGAPIAFGATLTSNPRDRSDAIAFLKMMLGVRGREIAAHNGLVPYPTALAVDPQHRMPAELRALTNPLAQK
jgi:molybdate/tungstate transport system substrate-binding protein